MVTVNCIDYSIAGLTAPEFCSYLIENELDHLYKLVPNEFIIAALAGGYGYFEVNREHIDLDLVRLQIHTPKTVRSGISCAIRLSAILNIKNGTLQEMSNVLQEDEIYVNFNSRRLILPAEIFSTQDFNLLSQYADFWQRMGTNNMWSKDYINNRLWLKARNGDFQFQFKLNVGLNPSTGVNCLGMENDIAMRGVTFLDTFSHLDDEAVGEAAVAKRQRTGNRKLEAAKGIRLPKR